MPFCAIISRPNERANEGEGLSIEQRERRRRRYFQGIIDCRKAKQVVVFESRTHSADPFYVIACLANIGLRWVSE